MELNGMIIKEKNIIDLSKGKEWKRMKWNEMYLSKGKKWNVIELSNLDWMF